MSIQHTSQCMHVDQRLEWLGIRKLHGHRVFMFRCVACGATIQSHSPLTDMTETRRLVEVSNIAVN